MASLVSEVSFHVFHNHTIKSAEQALFGNKSVYSTPSLSIASTSTGAPSKGSEKKGHKKSDSTSNDDVTAIRNEVAQLKLKNEQLQKEVDELRTLFEKHLSGNAAAAKPAPAPAAAGGDKGGDADEDFDLFGSDDEEESEEQKRIREERLSAYAAKKAKKPGPIAKSSVILDVKPWDDETDLKVMEERVRSIQKDGLLWGASKLIPVGYGIQKLQIVCTIEDEKISVDADLVEYIQEEFSDYVQSVDIVAFNKI